MVVGGGRVARLAECFCLEGRGGVVLRVRWWLGRAMRLVRGGGRRRRDWGRWGCESARREVVGSFKGIDVLEDGREYFCCRVSKGP